MKFDWSDLLRPSKIQTTIEELKDFEERLGCAFPDDYREFLLEFNGGEISVEHEIYVPELDCEVFVNYLWPLSAKSPFSGVKESREIQELNKLCLRQALRIGDDMGTGFFFLMMAGKEAGSIFYTHKDEISMREGDWYSNQIVTPANMAKLCPSFSALGRLILDHKCES